MLCKGAESHVLDRVISGHVDKTRDHIDQYAEVCFHPHDYFRLMNV